MISIVTIIFSCSKKEDIAPGRLIDPANADELSQVLIMPDNASEQRGVPPAFSTDSQTPRVTN